MKVTFKQRNGTQGLYWRCVEETHGIDVGGFGYTWNPAKTGGAFSRSHNPGVVTVYVFRPCGKEEEHLLGYRTRAEADKAARQWFREWRIRETLKHDARRLVRDKIGAALLKATFGGRGA